MVYMTYLNIIANCYSVKDGEFRLYKGERKADPLVVFINEKQWESLTPVPWYSNPDSPQ